VPFLLKPRLKLRKKWMAQDCSNFHGVTIQAMLRLLIQVAVPTWSDLTAQGTMRKLGQRVGCNGRLQSATTFCKECKSSSGPALDPTSLPGAAAQLLTALLDQALQN
jgi:hypothetical protein